MFFSSQIKTFGLDISDRSLKLALINMTAKGLKLAKHYRLDLPEGILVSGEIKKQDTLIKAIKKLLDESDLAENYKYVVACLPDTKTFSKLIKIKLPDKTFRQPDKLKELIKKEMPNHFPLSVDDVDFDWQIIKQKDENLEILVGVAPKNIVANFSKILILSGLFPVALEIEAEAIARAIFIQIGSAGNQPVCWLKQQLSYHSTKLLKKQPTTQPPIAHWKRKKIGSDKVYVVVDFGADRSGLIVWSDNTINFTASLKTNGNQLTQLISQKLKLDWRQAEKLKLIYGLSDAKNKIDIKKIVLPCLDELTKEISGSIEYYKNHFGEYNKFEIILTGGSANLIGLVELLSKNLGIKVELADPMENLKGCTKKTPELKNKQDYTTAIGLALRTHFINDF